MNENTTPSLGLSSRNELTSAVNEAIQTVGQSFENLCLLAGVKALTTMMDDDVNELAGEAYERNSGKPGYRWGRAKGRVGFHGGKVEIERPRVRSKATGAEMPLPSWQEAAEAGWLEEWATSMMLMNVATRKMNPAMRLPEAGVPSGKGSGLSRSAASRRFKVLTEERMAEGMSSDLSESVQGVFVEEHGGGGAEEAAGDGVSSRDKGDGVRRKDRHSEVVAGRAAAEAGGAVDHSF